MHEAWTTIMVRWTQLNEKVMRWVYILHCMALYILGVFFGCWVMHFYDRRRGLIAMNIVEGN